MFKRFFGWLYRHHYEVDIFLAGAYMEMGLQNLSEGQILMALLDFALMYIFISTSKDGL